MLVRTDSGGGTHEFLAWLTRLAAAWHYSVGITITEDMQEAILKSRPGLDPAYDAGGQVRPGAWVAEHHRHARPAGLAGGCGSSSARNAPTPARSCGSPTSTGTGSPASPPTPRAGSSPTWSCATAAGPAARTASAAKDTGLRNLPLHGFAQNQIWCEIVSLACELLAWMQMLALTGTARRWEPKRLRLRLFSVAGRLVHGGRRLRLRLAAQLALGHPDHRRNHPTASPRTRLTSRNPPCDQKGHPRGPWNPAHPARQPGHQCYRPLAETTAPHRGLRPASQDRENAG